MQPEQGQTYWQPSQDSEAPLEAESQSHDQNVAEVAETDEPISWQASEYIQHDKQMLWYVALGAVTIVLLLVSIFLIKSWSFAALVAVMGVSVGVMAGRPPHPMNYSLSSHGLHINNKTFAYHDFRAFGVIQEGPINSVLLIPTKRFMPMVTVYFPPELGEEIVDVLGAYLPMQHVELDLVEKISRRLRF